MLWRNQPAFMERDSGSDATLQVHVSAPALDEDRIVSLHGGGGGKISFSECLSIV